MLQSLVSQFQGILNPKKLHVWFATSAVTLLTVVYMCVITLIRVEFPSCHIRTCMLFHGIVLVCNWNYSTLHGSCLYTADKA